MKNGNGYKRKVDLAGELDQKIKEYQQQLKELKENLKEIARKKNKKMLEGNVFVAVFSPATTSKCEPKALLKLLRKRGEERKFPELVKVDLTQARRYLGEDATKIISSNKVEFGKIQLVRK